MRLSFFYRSLRCIFCLVLFFHSPVNAWAQGGGEAAIRSMLAAQVVEWNRGNIAGYMHGYWESDSLVFIGKHGPTYGFDSTLARYRKSYPDAAHMGKLSST